jgi:hypothetical protein
MPKHADDDPVIFTYSAMSSISFHGKRDSGHTWGEWREMNDEERDSAYTDFIYNTLGVDVVEQDPED